MIEQGSYAAICSMQYTFYLSMAVKKSVFGQPELGPQKTRNPLQDGTLRGGVGQVLSLSELRQHSWVHLLFGLVDL